MASHRESQQTLLQASREPHHRCESCRLTGPRQFVMLMYGPPIGVRCIVGLRFQAKAPTERETIKNGNYQSVVHLNIVARSRIESLSFGAIATELHVAPPSRVVPASIQEEPSTGFLTAFANVVNVR